MSRFIPGDGIVFMRDLPKALTRLTAAMHAHATHDVGHPDSGNEHEIAIALVRPDDLWMLFEALKRQTDEVENEREQRAKTDTALRNKDAAMGVLMKRLHDAGVDCSDLVS